MIIKSLKFVALVLVVIILLGVVLWFGPMLFDWEEVQELDPYRQRLLNLAAEEIASQLPQKDGILTCYVHLKGVERPSGRRTGFKTQILDALRDHLIDRGQYEYWTWFDLEEETQKKIFYLLYPNRPADTEEEEGESWWDTLRKQFGLPEVDVKITIGEEGEELPVPKSHDELLFLMGKVLKQEEGIDGILVVREHRFSRGKSNGVGAEVDLSVELYDPAKARYREDTSIRYEGKMDSAFGFLHFSTRMSQMSIIGRFILWILITAILPYLTFPITKKVIQMRKNQPLAIWLGVLSVASGFFAFFLMGFWIQGLFDVLTLVTAVGLAAAYNAVELSHWQRKFS